MDKLSAPQFVAALNALAEVFDRKAISAKALEVWFETLKEFDTNRVLGLLNSWAKSHGKFPAPAELWKVLNEEASERRERTALAEKKSFAAGERQLGATEHGRRKMAEIRAILASPKPTPLQHWTMVRQDPGAPAIAQRFADRFFERFAVPEREPGQDDEERYETSVAHSPENAVSPESVASG